MIIGEKTYVLETIDSTNNYAKKLAENGAVAGTVVWSKMQTAGRGTHGRNFESAAGNVFYSVIIKPLAMDISENKKLSYVNALAVYNAINKFIDGKSKLSIKWPNDILLNERKVAGSLLECGSDWIVIGTGINVVYHPVLNMMYPPTSLKNEGYAAQRDDIISELNLQLGIEMRYFMQHGFGGVREKYLPKAFKLNDEISIGNKADKSDYITGIYRGIDDDGCLLLKRGNEMRRFSSGSVNVNLA